MSADHPVWSVYDRLRSASLNVKYYGRRLESVEQLNFAIELVLLITAPSSAIAGLWFWDTEIGRVFWQYLGIIAAIAAVLKPMLALPKKIKDYESVLSGYRILEFDLNEIRSVIEQKRKYDPLLQEEFAKVIQRERTLVGKTPESRENHKIKAQCEKEVLQEFPVTSFYIPKE